MIADAAATAASAQVGVWAQDRTRTGGDGSSVTALEQDGVIWPELHRRLVESHTSTGDGRIPGRRRIS